MANCSNCNAEIKDNQLPEGAVVPDPPYQMINFEMHPNTNVVVAQTVVHKVYCPRCANSIGITLDKYLGKVAKKP